MNTYEVCSNYAVVSWCVPFHRNNSRVGDKSCYFSFCFAKNFANYHMERSSFCTTLIWHFANSRHGRIAADCNTIRTTWVNIESCAIFCISSLIFRDNKHLSPILILIRVCTDSYSYLNFCANTLIFCGIQYKLITICFIFITPWGVLSRIN